MNNASPYRTVIGHTEFWAFGALMHVVTYTEIYAMITKHQVCLSAVNCVAEQYNYYYKPSTAEQKSFKKIPSLLLK